MLLVVVVVPKAGWVGIGVFVCEIVCVLHCFFVFGRMGTIQVRFCSGLVLCVKSI